MLRPLLKSLDQAFLGGLVQRTRAEQRRKRQSGEEQRQVETTRAAIDETCGDHVLVSYNPSNTDLLSRLCDLHGSDKGTVTDTGHAYPWAAHSYSDYYSRLFRRCRLSVKRVFECGLGTNNPAFHNNMSINGRPGASLRVWRDYFPNAIVIGADIDREALFQEDRIHTYYIDQTDPPAIAAFWNEVNMTDFDLMIDDGYHVFEAGRCLFECSISMLSRDGLYVIEDVTFPDLRRYADYFRDLDYDVDFVTLSRPRTRPTQNNLVLIRHRYSDSPPSLGTAVIPSA